MLQTRASVRVCLLGVLGVILLCGAAVAQQTRVAVAAMAGVKSTRQAILGFQRALKKSGYAIQSTKAFLSEARSRGLERRIPSDAQGLVDLCGVLDVDAVIFVEIARPNRADWPRARRKDRIVDAIVYSGHDGGVLDQLTVRVPRGRLTREVWRKVARGLKRGLDGAVAPPPPPPPPIQHEPAYRAPRARAQPRETPEDIGGESADPTIVVHAGLSFRSRAFKWNAADTSPVFKNGGIEYDSALVPGIGIEAEFYPFRSASNLVKGIGIGLQFDKVFLATEQKEIVSGDDDGDLETTHQQLRLRVLYEYAISDAPDALRLHGLIGMGWLSFDVAGGEDYRGTAYQFFELGAGALMPIGTPMFNLDARFAYVPTANLGDTVEEVGKSASASGFNLQGGVLMKLPTGLTGRIAVEYQVFDIEPSGGGRGGRVGESAEDTYLGFRVQAGYRF